MTIRLGVLGCGKFASRFIPLFKAHPGVEEVRLCDLDEDKRERYRERFDVEVAYSSLEELCDSDVDAIAIFTQHWLHAPQAIQGLEAGKHVYSAVPTGYHVDEVVELVRAVERTGLVYMLGETTYYYPDTIYCRDRFAKGDFGHVVYSEAEYLHDMAHGLYEVFEHRRGADWRRESGDPPLYYPTHSVCFPVCVTRSFATHVCAHGFVDTSEEDRDIYRSDNRWGNAFSNETALMTMSDGSCSRINEFRRVAEGGVRMRVSGTEASFQGGRGESFWMSHDGSVEPVGHLLDHSSGFAPIQPVDRLPEQYLSMPDSRGHGGTHAFLVDDFVRACLDGLLPPCDVWQAARYMLPGLVGHESAMKGGERLEIPDLGEAPPGPRLWPSQT